MPAVCSTALRLFALTRDLGNILRTLATAEPIRAVMQPGTAGFPLPL